MRLEPHLDRLLDALVEAVVAKLLRGPEREEGAPVDRQSDRRQDSEEHHHDHEAVDSGPRSTDVRRPAARPATAS